MIENRLKLGLRRMASMAHRVARRCRRAAAKSAEVLSGVRAQARIDAACILRCRAGGKSRESGQGTTEYAILVGVLVVIAILAITVFRPRLQELWQAISDGINSL